MTAAVEELRMTPKGNVIEISAICLVFILLSLGGIVWDFTSGLLSSGIDGIMLLFVALMMALTFGLMWFYTLYSAGMLPMKPGESKPAPAAKAAAPAATAASKPSASAAPAPKPAAAPPAASPTATEKQ